MVDHTPSTTIQVPNHAQIPPKGAHSAVYLVLAYVTAWHACRALFIRGGMVGVETRGRGKG